MSSLASFAREHVAQFRSVSCSFQNNGAIDFLEIIWMRREFIFSNFTFMTTTRWLIKNDDPLKCISPHIHENAHDCIFANRRFCEKQVCLIIPTSTSTHKYNTLSENEKQKYKTSEFKVLVRFFSVVPKSRFSLHHHLEWMICFAFHWTLLAFLSYFVFFTDFRFFFPIVFPALTKMSTPARRRLMRDFKR